MAQKGTPQNWPQAYGPLFKLDLLPRLKKIAKSGLRAAFAKKINAKNREKTRFFAKNQKKQKSLAIFGNFSAKNCPTGRFLAT